jgi:hypothetical protein
MKTRRFYIFLTALLVSALFYSSGAVKVGPIAAEHG